MRDPTHHPLGEADTATKLAVLRMLAERSDLSQRHLSKALGVSLGKIHYVLHALLAKGLVKIESFSRSNNKLAYAYLLTPAGISTKSCMAREFLNFKLRQFEVLRSEIEALRQETACPETDAICVATSPSMETSASPSKLLPREPIALKVH